VAGSDVDTPNRMAASDIQIGISGTAVVVGHDGRLIDDNANRAVPIALGWQSSPEFNPMTVVEGHAPLGG